MKALTLYNPFLTKEILQRKADETPGAWIGIRIAGLYGYVNERRSGGLFVCRSNGSVYRPRP